MRATVGEEFDDLDLGLVAGGLLRDPFVVRSLFERGMAIGISRMAVSATRLRNIDIDLSFKYRG